MKTFEQYLLTETIQYEYQYPDDIEKSFYDFYIFYDWYNTLNRIKPGSNSDLSIKKIVYDGVKECIEYQKNLITKIVMNAVVYHIQWGLPFPLNEEKPDIKLIISIMNSVRLLDTNQFDINYINNLKNEISKLNIDLEDAVQKMYKKLKITSQWMEPLYVVNSFINEKDINKCLFLIDKLYHMQHRFGYIMSTRYSKLRFENVNSMLEIRKNKNPEDYVNLSSIPQNIFDKISQELS